MIAKAPNPPATREGRFIPLGDGKHARQKKHGVFAACCLISDPVTVRRRHSGKDTPENIHSGSDNR